MYDRHLHPLLVRFLEGLKPSPFSKKHAGFVTRLSAAFDEFYREYMRIYGHVPGAEQHFLDLLSSLWDAHRDRPEDLHARDRQREANTDWYLEPKLVAAQIYLDRYAGDLAGLQRHLDYLQELGITVVHLMPILDMPEGENDGGYAVRDYRKIDRRFGTMEQVEELSRELTRRGMLLQMDLVVNHTADSHEWARKARAGDPAYIDYYYFYNDRTVPDAFEASMPEVFPATAPGNFTHIPELDKWVMTVFHRYQWDLNYTNPTVFREMVGILLYLANRGIDVIRLDAVPFLWKQIGTNCQNLEQAHQLLRLFALAYKTVVPSLVTISEAIVQPHEVVRYFGDGDFAGRETEIAYHVSLMVLLWDAVATTNVRLLTTGLENMPEIPRGCTWLTYIRCHDDIGIGFSDDDARAVGYDPAMHRAFWKEMFTGKFPGSVSRGELFMENKATGDARISGSAASLAGLEYALSVNDPALVDAAIDKLCMLYGVVFSYGGIPIVYYGDEIGYLNDYAHRNREAEREDNRWMHRPIFDWDKAALAKEQGTVEYRIYHRMQRMIAARKAIAEFGHLTQPELVASGNEHVFTFLRHLGSSRTLVAANVSPQAQVIPQHLIHRIYDVPEAGNLTRVQDVITGSSPTIQQGQLLLQPYQILWLRDPG
ncbi:amylosucrase [Spirochaeta africana]|uniref:Glycosidase n=1 Tax=Spirochaeta africana (strain ATCC 700263 / DSM 8902 / Z-7692) TaxID=889378 RepID=H9UH14_SPIAZ|nr:amylosucrase [Spirochaeta africana]AFG36807.1 glycosidase [Spirochaeta africana DSM 8902]